MGLCLSWPGPAWGLNLIPLFDSQLGDRPGIFSYRLRYHDQTGVEGQEAHLTRTAQDLDMFWPVLRRGDNEFNIYGGYSVREYDTGLRFPESGREFPEDLYRIRLGFGFEHRTRNGFIWSLVHLVTSPSDKPFSGPDVMGLNSTLVLRIPHREENAWILFLNYSSTRSFLKGLPLPGLGYWFEKDKVLRVMLGLPFALDWRPVERFSLTATYIPLQDLSAKLTYNLAQNLRAYSGFSWSHSSYFLADRAREEERLYSYEKRLTLGMEIRLTDFIRLDLSAGYCFDRYLFFGEGYQDRDQDRVDLEEGLVLTATLGFGFKWW